MLDAESNLRNAPESDSHSQSTPKSKMAKKRLWLWIGGTLCMSVAGGMTWGWLWLQRELPPLVEKEVANFLNRPVKLGSVESLTSSGIRFGPSEILTTPTDPAKVSLKALDMGFNPLTLLMARELQLKINAIQPQIYLEQGKQGDWLLTKLDPLYSRWVKVDLQQLRFQDAKAIIVARSPSDKLQPAVTVFLPGGQIDLSDNGKVIDLKANAQFASGGKLNLSGRAEPEAKTINLLVRGNQLPARDISHLLALPARLERGTIDANLEMKLKGGELPRLQGVATVQGLQINIAKLPQPLSQSQGQLRFQGREVRLENITTRLGAIAGVVNGVIDLQKGVSLQAETQSFAISQGIQALKLNSPPISLKGAVKATIYVTGALNQPDLSLDLATTQPTRIDRWDFHSLRAQVKLGESSLSVNNLKALPSMGGEITGAAQIQVKPGKGRNLAFSIQHSAFSIQNLPSREIARLAGTKLPIDLGLVSAQTKITGLLNDPKTLQAKGSANFRLGEGRVNADQIQYANGRWQAELQASGVHLASLEASLPVKMRQGELTGNFQLSGTNNFQSEQIQATGSAKVAIAGGSLSFPQLQIASGRWQTTLQAQGLNLSQLLPETPSHIGGILRGEFNLAGNLKQPLTTVQGTGKASLAIAGGVIAANKVQLAAGQFKAEVIPQGLQLARFSRELRGDLDGQLNISGKLDSLRPETMQAKGDLRLSQGLSLLHHPLSTSLYWTGERLEIQQATAPGFSAKGYAEVDWARLTRQPDNLSGVKQFDLQVAAQGLNLQSLPLPPSMAKIDYSGQVDFQGAIAGTPQQPKIEGKLALDNFQLEGLAWERVLSGKLQGNTQDGVNLQLAGIRDRLQLSLNPQYQPISFLLETDQVNLKGFQQGEEFLIHAQQVPLSLLSTVAKARKSLIPSNLHALLEQPLSGYLSGYFAFHLQTFALSGKQVAIANPQLGRFKSDRLAANFRYLGGNLSLSEGQLDIKKSQYRFNGTVAQMLREPQVQAEITISQGQVQDVLESLQIFEFADLNRGFTPPNFKRAAALYGNEVGEKKDSLFSVGSPEVSLMEQLNDLSAIAENLRQEQEKEALASPVPKLAELQGSFDGKLKLTASQKAGIQASFDFQGQAWQWGKFICDRLIAQGNWRGERLSLDNVSLQAGASLLNFSGSLDPQKQAGQLQLVNIPLNRVAEWLAPPTNLTVNGLLNGTVSLGGRRENPQAKGQIRITQALINQTPLPLTESNFIYRNARFNFAVSSLFSQEADPVMIQGTIPYAFPFATVKPDSDRLSLSLNVKDKGLSLLNILTKGEMAWVDGKGEVQMNIIGRFDSQQLRPQQITAQGIARLENGILTAQVIPETPLTQVNGIIHFDLDRLYVENLTGQFGGGRVIVAGSLPILQATPQKQPLSLRFDDLAFNHLKGLYQGGVKGDIQVTGSAFKPSLGGKIELFNGKVLLEEILAETKTEISLPSGVAFAGLQLNLGENLQITRSPILNFLAKGSLILNSDRQQIRPEGTIYLTGGQVNLFASQLRLAAGEENTAQFFPNRGLDPYLNVQLVTAATETLRNPVRLNSSSSEISEPFSANAESLQTVRIQARVQGFASQLNNSIELTSNPNRNPSEIISLLGGGFVNTLNRGDATLGLANLAGSAVFGTIQGEIGAALGLSEFRIFPTQLVDETEGITQDQIGVAAEAGVNVTNNLSLSIQKIFNTDRPPQLGIRYRLNDRTTLRGSSNFSDDNRAIIEYEQRF